MTLSRAVEGRRFPPPFTRELRKCTIGQPESAIMMSLVRTKISTNWGRGMSDPERLASRISVGQEGNVTIAENYVQTQESTP
jgi:hypothetical protein